MKKLLYLLNGTILGVLIGMVLSVLGFVTLADKTDKEGRLVAGIRNYICDLFGFTNRKTPFNYRYKPKYNYYHSFYNYTIDSELRNMTFGSRKAALDMLYYIKDIAKERGYCTAYDVEKYYIDLGGTVSGLSKEANEYGWLYRDIEDWETESIIDYYDETIKLALPSVTLTSI